MTSASSVPGWPLLAARPGFCFHAVDISDRAAMAAVVAAEPGITGIVHLAAQAGVRYSMVAPFDYLASNLTGHLVVLEEARRLPRLRHLVYASSSSVYGANSTLPFRETDRVDTPLSLYAATKRADELMSHAYGHLYGIPQTGLRFFTVYGPWGRPDMAYFSFAQAIMRGEPITVYDEGRLLRDFTYIDDIVGGVVGCLDRPPSGQAPPVRILNIGNTRAETVARLIALLEAALGRQGDGGSCAAAGGGRGGDLCGGRGDRRADRICAADQPCGRHSAVRRVVPGVAGTGVAGRL